MENLEMTKLSQRFAVLIVAALVFFTQSAQAAGAPKAKATPKVKSAAGPASGWGAGLQDAISDFQSKLPNIFKELTPEDIGNKPHIKTHFGASSSFTSDADLGQNENRPAMLTRISSGLTLQAPIGDRLYTEVDYTFSLASALGTHTHSSTVSHNVSALANYKLTDATSLGLKNNSQWSQLPGSVDEMFFLNTSDAGVNHRFSDILNGHINDQFQWFRDRAVPLSQEFIDNGVSGGVDYKISDRVTLSPTTQWNVRHFDDIGSKDYWQYRYALGASYKVGPRTTLAAHAGHNIRQFNEGSDRTDHSIIYGIGITNSLNKKTSWHLDYNKDTLDTFDTSFVNRETSDATNLDNLDRDFRVVKTHRISTGINYQMAERHSVALFADTQFTRTDAEDNVLRLRENDESAMEFGPSYSYRFNRYISFDLKYVFGERFTSQDSGSGRGAYTFHKIGGGLTVSV